ncbi:hypothetical protein ROZALSC1DRAFT_31595, partial [Rozella allomycis CSF55]
MDWIDDRLYYVRTFVNVSLVVSSAVFGYKYLRHFSSVHQIPEMYFKRHIFLKGTVGCDTNGEPVFYHSGPMLYHFMRWYINRPVVSKERLKFVVDGLKYKTVYLCPHSVENGVLISSLFKKRMFLFNKDAFVDEVMEGNVKVDERIEEMAKSPFQIKIKKSYEKRNNKLSKFFRFMKRKW